MAKRITDLTGGAALLLVTAPVVALGAVVSALTYRTSPFFVQYRVGQGGRLFRLVKIRTLHPSTPSSLPKYDLEDHLPSAGGRFLRAHHLDELPQLVHVVLGRMSLVGPRPEMPSLTATFPLAFAELRTRVRPGITGLWQISRAVEGLIGAAPEYDRYYVANRTNRLDLWILWRTAGSLLGRSPIESLDEVPAWTRPRHGVVDHDSSVDPVAA